MSPRLPDADARARALDLSRHVLTMAPAGSGKTGLLVQRLLGALAQVEEPEQVVAITFTNKAAAEIRLRILKALDGAEHGTPVADPHEQALRAAAEAVLARDRAHGWHLRDHPSRLRAVTIDALNAQLAGQLPLLSGLGGTTGIIQDPQGLYYEAISGLFADLEDRELPQEDRAALEAVLRLADNRLDRLLEPLAALLERREQWLPQLARVSDRDWEADEERALAVLVGTRLDAFNTRLGAGAKQQLLSLLQLGAAAGEEALAWATGLERWPEPRAESVPVYRRLAGLLVTQNGTLRSPTRSLNKNHGFPPRASHTLRVKALLESLQGDDDLAAACAEVLLLPDPAYPEPLRRLQRQLLRVLRRLAAHLRLLIGQAGQADFTEIALAARSALLPESGYSEALLSADRRIRHLLVDEMQDTSEGQVELLKLLTQGWEPGDGRSLFMVGDPQQSIYAFRKAEVRLFLELWQARRLGQLPLDCLQLTANFRSDGQLVDWFNASFAHIFPPRSDPWSGVVRYAPSAFMRDRTTGHGVVWHVTANGNAEQEAAAVAERIAHLKTQDPDASVAVLARARTHLGPTLRALRRLNIRYACQDVDPLAALPAVRDYVQLARALWHPEDRLAWAVLLRAPFVGLSWSDLVALSRARQGWSWPARLRAHPSVEDLSAEGRARLLRLLDAWQRVEQHPDLCSRLPERTEALWHELGGPAAVTPDEYTDVRAAMCLLREHAPAGEIADLERFQRALDALYGAPAVGAVDVLTIHKAKGLEFDHVLLVGCGRATAHDDPPLLQFRGTPDGDILVPRPPISLDRTDSAWRLYDYLQHLQKEGRRNERLRLLYVAATRARKSLHLFIDLARNREGELLARSGSFAELLFPVVPVPAVAAEGSATETEAASVPRAPRLPLDFAQAPEQNLYRPRERRTLKPSEAVLQDGESRPEPTGDVYAQLVGTLLHQALQKAAEDGLQGWNEGGAGRRNSLTAGLRRMGLPEPRVEAGVARILELLDRTLASPTGRWLLSPKPWARNEFQIAGYRDGRWVAAVIDRCFEDEDGTLWIVDYKSSAEPLPREQYDRYVNDGVAHYAPQLSLYAELLSQLRPDRPVRAALYFLEADRLVEPASLRPAAA